MLACLESRWNAPRVHVGTVFATRKAGLSAPCTVACAPSHPLLDTQRPWYVSAHVHGMSGLFVCTSELRAGVETAALHSSGAQLVIRCDELDAAALRLRVSLASWHFKPDTPVRVKLLLHHAISNDGAAIAAEVYEPALAHARRAAQALAHQTCAANALAAAQALVHDAFSAFAADVAPADVFLTEELAALRAWTLAHAAAHVPPLSCVPRRFLNSAYESAYLALGARWLADARRDSILLRIAAFVSAHQAAEIREAMEALSAHVHDVYSLASLNAQERETHSCGEWLRGARALATRLLLAFDALIPKSM